MIQKQRYDAKYKKYKRLINSDTIFVFLLNEAYLYLIYFTISLFLTPIYLKIVIPFIPIIMSFFPLYLIKLLLEEEVEELVLRIKGHWTGDLEPISPLLVNHY